MKPRKTLRTIILAAASLAALSAPVLAAGAPAMTFDLIDSSGGKIGRGSVAETDAGLLFHVEAEKLPPGWHGAHIHGVGACVTPDFKSAGDHMQGAGESHGVEHSASPHDGDLPNLRAAGDGSAGAEFFRPGMKLADLKTDKGSAFVIHAKPDDYMTQPSGGAGDRIACGVIAPEAKAQ